MSNTDSKKEAGHKKAPKISLKPDFKIENIVASADLGVELDLYAIESHFSRTL